MGGHEHRGALGGGRGQQLDHVGRALGIEVAGRLVGQDQLRPAHDRPGHGQTAPLTGRKLRGIGVRAPAETRLLELELGAGFGLRARQPQVGQLQRQRHILDRGPLRNQEVVLGDYPDPAPEGTCLAPAALVERDAVNPYLSRRRPQHAREQPEQAGLAGTGRAHQEDELAGMQLETDAVERAHVSVAKTEPLDVSERGPVSRCRQRCDRCRYAPEQLGEYPQSSPVPSDA